MTKCLAELFIDSDDFQAHVATMICGLEPGHPGDHQEVYYRADKPGDGPVGILWSVDSPVTIRWSVDDREINPGGRCRIVDHDGED